jgi:outer membrane protein TolC
MRSQVLLATALLAALPRSAAAQAQTPTQAQGLEQIFADELGRPGGLTSDEVARRAATTSPTVAGRTAESEAAVAGVDQARANFIPRLQGQARRSRLSSLETATLGNLVVVPPGTPPGPIPAGTPMISAPLTFPQVLDQTVLQASLSVPLSDYALRLPQAKAAAEGSARSAAQNERAAVTRAAADARLAYYGWVRVRLSARVARQALAQARQHLEDARAARDAGSASVADVLRVESQVASSELDVARTANLEGLAEERLRTAMHDAGTAPYAIGEELRERAVPPASGRLPTMLDEAKGNRPELRALDEAVGAARQQVKLTRAAAYPRLDATGTATYANPNQRVFPQDARYRGTWDASLVLTWTPTDLPATLAAVRAAEARVRQLEAQRGEIIDGLRIEITQAAQALDEATVAQRTTTRGLAAAEESYRVRRLLFQNGRATSVEQTDAELELTRARLDALNARVDQRIAQVRLDHALGRDTTPMR